MTGVIYFNAIRQASNATKKQSPGVAAAITFIKNMGSARRASPAAQRPTQVARRRPPTIPTGPARTGPARMMKGGMYK